MNRSKRVYRRRLTNLDQLSKTTALNEINVKEVYKINKLRKANIQLKEDHEKIMSKLVKVIQK